MQIPDTIRQRILKVKALADAGATESERDTAWQMLEKLLKSHNLRIEDLERPETKLYTFTFETPYEEKLLVQLCGYVQGFRSKELSYFKKKRSRKSLMFELTEAEYADVKTLYPFYLKAWREELANFYAAFIGAQGLGRGVDADECTPEELMMFIRRHKMQESITALPSPRLLLADGG